MTTTFKAGDIVCFSSAFLKSVQWNTDVPSYGQVLEVKPKERAGVTWDSALVLWCDESDSWVNFKNLVLESEKHLEPA